MTMAMQQDIEQKELLDRQRFVEMLREWVNALERNEDFNVSVAGNQYTIPANAVDIGRCRVEYEIDKGEYEFELTVKWRE
jgi:amphi-Trp domain-containing protein